MKKIIPFSNVLEFKTSVSEITAISLEHEITKSSDSISGNFLISGEYRITPSDINSSPFSFSLPFDIALGQNYNQDTIVIDIDDFRYKLEENKKLKVSIDLYLDGEIIPEPVAREEPIISPIEIEEETKSETVEENRVLDDDSQDLSIDILDSIAKGEEKVTEENQNIENNNLNINENNNLFSNITTEEKYVTYKVYCVGENDTIDSIITKYNTTKEELAEYNNLEDIHPGDKLLIPANEK